MTSCLPNRGCEAPRYPSKPTPNVESLETSVQNGGLAESWRLSSADKFHGSLIVVFKETLETGQPYEQKALTLGTGASGDALARPSPKSSEVAVLIGAPLSRLQLLRRLGGPRLMPPQYYSSQVNRTRSRLMNTCIKKSLGCCTPE